MNKPMICHSARERQCVSRLHCVAAKARRRHEIHAFSAARSFSSAVDATKCMLKLLFVEFVNLLFFLILDRSFLEKLCDKGGKERERA